MKILQLSINLSTAIFISLVINCLFSFPAKTEAIKTVQNQSVPEQPEKLSQDKQFDFSGDGRPGRRKGGGSRSPCPTSEIPLTALVPDSNIGSTVSDRPSLWFYVPYNPQQVGAGEFVLQDEQEKNVYRQTFTLPQAPGLVNLKLPQNEPPLDVNRPYRWYFKLYCNDYPSATANFVEGWIERIPLDRDLAARLQKKSNPAYKEHKNELIWFDSLDTLARLRSHKNNPQLERDWIKLLSATGVDLDDLSEQPLTGEVIYTNQNNNLGLTH